jgi:hypothetical protein
MTLPTGALLQLWEQGEALGPIERALTLAEAGGADVGALRSRPYGRINAGVLSFRQSLLGSDLAATAGCPRCGTRVEFTVSGTGLLNLEAEAGSPTVEAGEYVVGWRPPTPDDLLQAAAAAEPGRVLQRRCLTVAAGGVPADPAVMPADLLERVERTISEADPLAEVIIALVCPECGMSFESDLDLGSFVWAEVEAQAKRLLHEVDTLARVYGWTEPEVLALSEGRRSAYVRLALDGVP